MAEWSTAYVNDLPDSAFLYIESGGSKDGDGRTTPRDLRHFPVRDDTGEVDLPHLRNALARIPQSDLPDSVKEAVTAKAERLLASEQSEQDSDADDAREDAVDPRDLPNELLVAADEMRVEVRDAALREMDVRLLPYGKAIDTLQGPEMFVPGAFDGTDPSKVLLYGPSHAARIGLGQDMKPTLVRVPTGKGLRYWDGPDGPYMTFRVARTQEGDEQLALAADGIASGVSVEFSELPGGTRIQPDASGRRLRVHQRALLRGATTTHRPAYGEQAAVVAMRSQSDKETPVPETQEAPVAGAPFDQAALVAQMREAFGSTITDFEGRFAERITKLEERARQEVTIPAPTTDKPTEGRLGAWARAAIGILSGERVADTQLRDLADLITSDNVGVVPPTYSQELIGVIAAVRPFMESTRKLTTPATGMSLILPKLVTRPSVANQADEKTQVSSTATEITTATFTAITEAGGGDLSLQILKRSSPEFLALYLELLAEAYAIKCDHDSTAALLADGGINDGGTIDPTSLSLATAYGNSFGAIKQGPDSIWLSTAGYGAFLDANYSIGGAAIPLYPSLSPTGAVGGGAVGSIRNLRAFVVPALDDQSVDAIIGPSRGFAWAEDGTYTLQVDVPAKAGRDVALVGMIWPAVMYGAAFTTFALSA